MFGVVPQSIKPSLPSDPYISQRRRKYKPLIYPTITACAFPAIHVNLMVVAKEISRSFPSCDGGMLGLRKYSLSAPK